MCLDFRHAETGAVFVAETAFVAGLDQRDTPRNMEWTHHATNLDSLVVCKAGDTSLSSVDIVIHQRRTPGCRHGVRYRGLLHVCESGSDG